MDDFATAAMDKPTPAMCTAWRLFRDHGAAAADVIERELARCLKAGDHQEAATWRSVAEALEEWL
jgi:hypothetical protein